MAFTGRSKDSWRWRTRRVRNTLRCAQSTGGTGCRLLDVIATALDTDPKWFRTKFAQPMLFLRPLHYSGKVSTPSQGIFAAGAHSGAIQSAWCKPVHFDSSHQTFNNASTSHESTRLASHGHFRLPPYLRSQQPGKVAARRLWHADAPFDRRRPRPRDPG